MLYGPHLLERRGQGSRGAYPGYLLPVEGGGGLPILFSLLPMRIEKRDEDQGGHLRLSCADVLAVGPAGAMVGKGCSVVSRAGEDLPVDGSSTVVIAAEDSAIDRRHPDPGGP